MSKQFMADDDVGEAYDNSDASSQQSGRENDDAGSGKGKQRARSNPSIGAEAATFKTVLQKTRKEGQKPGEAKMRRASGKERQIPTDHARTRKKAITSHGSEEGRTSKNAPTEMSSKRPVKRMPGKVESAVQVRLSSKKGRSSDACPDHFEHSALEIRVLSHSAGRFDPTLFRQSYSFLQKARAEEVEAIKKTVAASSKSQQVSDDERSKLLENLRKTESQEESRRVQERERGALQEWKREEKAKRQEGKRPFHLKKADKKELYLKAKFDYLSEDKRKLRRAIDRRRKKTSAKDKKATPSNRVAIDR